MNQQVKRMLQRAGAAFGALGLGTALTVVSLLSPSVPLVGALPPGGQVQSRSIEMSSSTISATNQTYLVSFKPASSYTIKGIVVDFCSTSPIIGDTTCSAPTGFDLGGATPTVNMSPGGVNGATDIGGTWTAAGVDVPSPGNPPYTTLKLTNATGVSLTGGTSYDFAVTSVTNPSTLGTFYARIITYQSATGEITTYAPGSEGTTVGDATDYGGFALSTTTNINITAKVQETLTFCTSGPISATFNNESPLDGANVGNGGGSDCSAATAPSLTIGHGSPVAVIDNGQIDAAYAFTQLSTNATSGAVIRMHAGNACANAGLSVDGGTNCNIPGLDNTTGGGAAVLSAAVPNTGAAAFGLFVSASRTTTGVAASTGTITPSTDYNDGTHTTESTAPAQNDMFYGMVNDATGVTSTYGSVIASSTGPLNTINNDLVFAAIASLTTPAGIYQGSESLIATGTF